MNTPLEFLYPIKTSTHFGTTLELNNTIGSHYLIDLYQYHSHQDQSLGLYHSRQLDPNAERIDEAEPLARASLHLAR